MQLVIRLTKSLKLIYLVWLMFCGKASSEVIVLASGEWPPFLSKQQPHGGFAAHVVSEVFKQLDHQVLYRYYPWARAEHMVKHGQVRGSVVWSHTDERAQFALFSEPVVELESVVFHLKQHPFDWQTITDFRKKIVCLPMGSSTDFFTPLLHNSQITLERPVDIKAGFQLLLRKRCDLMTISKDVGTFVLRQHFTKMQIEALTHHEKPIKQLSYSLMLGKHDENNGQLLKRFNHQLKQLKDSGTLVKMKAAFAQGHYDPADNTK